MQELFLRVLLVVVWHIGRAPARTTTAWGSGRSSKDVRSWRVGGGCSRRCHDCKLGFCIAHPKPLTLNKPTSTANCKESLRSIRGAPCCSCRLAVPGHTGTGMVLTHVDDVHVQEGSLLRLISMREAAVVHCIAPLPAPVTCVAFAL